LWSTTETLLELLGRLSDRPSEDVESEVREHLALRIAFILIAEAEGAPNFSLVEQRVRERLRGVPPENLRMLTRALALSMSQIDSWSDTPRAALMELPYPVRQRMLRAQGDRCALCGWPFADEATAGNRSEPECSPTLDHRIPYRIGGNTEENLWILCGRCNAIKEAALHIGEHGRIWTNNYLYLSRPRVVAFWTFTRDRQCRVPGCGAGPSQTRLFCARCSARGEVVVDNCRTLCEQHRDPDNGVEY